MFQSEKNVVLMTKIMLAVFFAVVSIFICAKKVPETSFASRPVERLEETQSMVMRFSAATLAVSVGITLLPDDFATPLAGTLADMSKYFVLILGMVFLEKLIVLEGIPIAFGIVIPIVCGFFILYFILRWEIAKTFAKKLLFLAIAMILVVPCSTFLSDVICAKYENYVYDTIELAEAGTDRINEISFPAGNDKSWFEKVSDVFETAITGVKELFDYFSSIVEKCINSIAILFVITCGIPVLTFMLLIWLLKQLFQVQGVELLADKINLLYKNMRPGEGSLAEESGNK